MPYLPAQIAIVGSSSLRNSATEANCVALGRMLAKSGFSVVCGGLGGVMSEVCRGFKTVSDAPGVTVGILPGYDFASANPFIDIVIPSGIDLGRNQLVVASGRVVIAIGGGAGTLSEIALASQLNKPIILLRGGGGWADRLDSDFLDQRRNARLYPCHSITEVADLLHDLLRTPAATGPINSGHHHRAVR